MFIPRINYREMHARKNSRVNTLTDVFNRALDTSDPIISSVSLRTRLSKKHMTSLPVEVIRLLSSPELNLNKATFDSAELCASTSTSETDILKTSQFEVDERELQDMLQPLDDIECESDLESFVD